MEEAALSYPEQRTPEADERLLETYLSLERPAAARRLVMELAARARANPADAPHLAESAIVWGDYLYRKGDFRAAADAFSIAIEAADRAHPAETTPRNDPSWAKYQRANALLALSDFDGSIALFQEVAASDAPWAAEAGLKADYARLEQRRRGIVEVVSPGREG
jgi:tetratricopeptide (TPR) repeat protein